MNKIAEGECATCHVIRPKTEMRSVRVRRKSGSSFGFWRSSVSDRTGNSYRTSYAHDQVWVCKDCKPPRSDWTPLHYAAAAVVLWLGWVIVAPILSSSQTPSAQGTPPAAMTLDNSSNDALTNSDDREGNTLEDRVVASEPASDDASPTAGASEEGNGLDAITSSVSAQSNAPDPLDIARARNAALTTGNAASWKSNGRAGWVTVSAPVATSRGVCKSISVQDSSGELIGSTETWCSDAGSPWSQPH